MSLTAVVFVLGFLACCVAALARHPVFGLLAYVGVFYVHPPAQWWGQGFLLDVRWSLIAAVVTWVAVLRIKPQHRVVPFLGSSLTVGMMLFVVLLAAQLTWAMDVALQLDLLVLFAKYALLIWLVCRCIETEQHLKFFLWAHVLGCFYFGWDVYTTYEGGRFEGFEAPGVSDANSGAMQIVTGIFTASALFLSGRKAERAALIGVIPFIINALVATVSRSAALAVATGGIMFNLFTPRPFRWWVRMLSVLAAVLFVMLTNELFWTRMETLQYKGEYVEGTDTGAGRIAIIHAQWRMFKAHPMGCGHRCTAVLSPYYMPDEMLTGEEGLRARSSHNSVMTMLVEHGFLGEGLYLGLLLWISRSALVLFRRLRSDTGLIARTLPAVVAVLVAITIGDFFVDYVKLEVRIWFIAILLLMLNMTQPMSDDRRRGEVEVPCTVRDG